MTSLPPSLVFTGRWRTAGVLVACLLMPTLALAAPQRIVGYLPRYQTVRPEQFKPLTHVIVFSVVPDEVTGAFKVFSNDPETGETIFEAPPGGSGLSSLMIDQVVAEAASYGTKVGLCIGGTAVHPQFQNLVINGKVDVFADFVRDFAVAHGLDEINIDWEKPSVAADPGRAETIFAALSQRLKPLGIDLTAAWTASTGATYALNAARLCEPYSDAVYVMSYQSQLTSFQTRFEFYTKPVGQGGMGYPAAKVCPGIQFFGRDSARTLVKTYSQLVDLAGGDIDPALNSMVVEGKTLLYTGQDELGAMCDYSQQVGAGVMFWEIGQDSDPTQDDALLGVIHDRLTATSNTGTPHWWLRTHGIPDDYENAVLLDPDGDAQPTWQEYISDTEPLAGASRLELVAAPDGIRFETHLDRDYTVMESPDLSAASWATSPGYPISGTGAPVTLAYPPGIARRFYRLEVNLTAPAPPP